MNLLHNSGVPFRMGVRTRSVPAHERFNHTHHCVARLQIVSFVWALAYQIHRREISQNGGLQTSAPREPHRPTAEWYFKDSLETFLEKEEQRLRKSFATPTDLFATIGPPKAPQWTPDFLIGHRTSFLALIQDGSRDNLYKPAFCEDPLLCAGILSRCVGAIYLNRRSPVLSWDTLLSPPLAFDDPHIQF
jgi:hypothetical protein